jgi:hypothetical protein
MMREEEWEEKIEQPINDENNKMREREARETKEGRRNVTVGKCSLHNGDQEFKFKG